MADVSQPPAQVDAGKRVLGLEPATLVLALLALGITAGTLFMQMRIREGQFEPENVLIFHRLFAFEDYGASFLFIAALIVAAFPEAQRVAIELARWIGERPVLVSAVSGALLAAGAVWVYQAHPLAMDEAAPYMQSKIFASGALVGHWPPALHDWLIYPPFQNYFIHTSAQTGAVASSYWPGFALILTPFTAAGVPWLCNPVLGALSVWIIHRLALKLTDSRVAAGAAALLTLASAAFVVNSISFYSMTAHLLCNAVFALLLLEPTPKRTFIAGLVGGLALTLHNPVPHMLFAAPWLAWLAFHRNRWKLLASIAAGYLPWILIAGFGWSHLLQTLKDGSSDVPKANAAAGDQIGQALTRLGDAFNLPRGIDLWNRAIATGKLWLWTAPLALLLAGMGFWRHRADTRFRLLLASVALTFVGYLFVRLDQGHGWGYRYFHSVWFVLPVFAAAALLPKRGAAADDSVSEPGPTVRWTLAGALGGLFLMVPYFAWQVHSFIGTHLAQQPLTDKGTPRVMIYSLGGYYTQDLVQNDPFLRDLPIRMVTHGKEADAQMMAREFPDLVLLKRTYKGTVWGYPVDPARPAQSGAQRVSPQ